MHKKITSSSLKNKNAGQGAIEYLLIIGAVILIVAVVIIALSGVITEVNTGVDKNQTTTTNDPLKENLADSMGKYYIPQGAIENYKYTGEQTTIETIASKGENIKICILENCNLDKIIENNNIISIQGTPTDGTILKTNLEPTTQTQDPTITYTQQLNLSFYKPASIYLNPKLTITLQNIVDSNPTINAIYLARPITQNYEIVNAIKINGTWKTRNDGTPVNLTDFEIKRLDTLQFGNESSPNQEFIFEFDGTLPNSNSFENPRSNQYIIQLVENFECLTVQNLFNDLNASKTINDPEENMDEENFNASLTISANGTSRQMFYDCWLDEDSSIDCSYSENSIGEDQGIDQFKIINLSYSNITFDQNIQEFFKCP